MGPVDDWAAFERVEIMAGSAGPSTPDGRRNAVSCIAGCLKSVPTPVMSKIRFLAFLEGSLLDFLACLAVREALPVDDIECGRNFFVCSAASGTMISGGAAFAVELEAWK